MPFSPHPHGYPHLLLLPPPTRRAAQKRKREEACNSAEEDDESNSEGEDDQDVEAKLADDDEEAEELEEAEEKKKKKKKKKKKTSRTQSAYAVNAGRNKTGTCRRMTQIECGFVALFLTAINGGMLSAQASARHNGKPSQPQHPARSAFSLIIDIASPRDRDDNEHNPFPAHTHTQP